MAPQIFKATYSGVPVYEMITEGVSVMRRRADGWFNATQILKVAGFDKPQRTRVLEREVQKGHHEKVQGGYGKYQGTWVPPESAIAIARQYDVESQLRPIIDYRPSNDSPPPAPKHSVGASLVPPPYKNEARHRSPGGYSSAQTRSARYHSQDSHSDQDSFTEGSRTSAPSATPSPLVSMRELSHDGLDGPTTRLSPSKRKRQSPEEEIDFKDIMLEFFLSDTAQTPQILINPPPGIDLDVLIDEDGHTALHWAAAMGCIRVVKLLVSAGADVFKVNKAGQTALMRSVMFANNYDIRKFAELYEMLHRTSLNIDSYNRTVLHHIADLALSKGKIHAARYYMETVLVRLADYPKEMSDIINFQDEDGETALTMAARCRSKRMVKVLLDHGADPFIKNKDQKSAEDYILDDERFHSSPTISSRALFRIGALDPKTQQSPAVLRAGDEIYNAMSAKFDELLVCLDSELRLRERQTFQAKGILAQLEREVQTTQEAIDQLKAKKGGDLDAKKERMRQLETEYRAKTLEQSRLGMLEWMSEEEAREEAIWASGRGLTKETIAFSSPSVLKGSSPDEDVTDLAELYSNIPKSQESLDELCSTVRQEVAALQQETNNLIDQYTRNLIELPDYRKLQVYRRLVAAALPELTQDGADVQLDDILKVMFQYLRSCVVPDRIFRFLRPRNRLLWPFLLI
ncbi:hypothetical protein FRC19_006984 [Serendipita sp. 401]|nr:hypothetical protein FRC19_006984 [Serendipita sp. 401]